MNWYWYIIIIWVGLGVIGALVLMKGEKMTINWMYILTSVIYAIVFGAYAIKEAVSHCKALKELEKLSKKIEENDRKEGLARIGMIKREQRNKKISSEEREAVAWWINRNMSWLINTDDSRWHKLWPKEWEEARKNYIIDNNL